MKKYKILKGKVIDSVSGRHEAHEATLSDKRAEFYRNRIELIKPDSLNKVSEIKEYLDSKDIDYDSTLKKAELLELV